MRKLRIVIVAMLVLIAATACQPRYIFVPIPGGNGGNGNQGAEPTVSTQEEFETALANGESVVLPSGTFTLPTEVTGALDITGTDGTQLTIPVEATDPTPEADDNRGVYTLPAGSSLRNLTIVFSADASSQITTYAEPGESAGQHDPAFAMLISGSATLDGVTLKFPEDGSLSGINVYQAEGTVSLSDITIIGNPRRAPINITKSTVNFSGTFNFDQNVAGEAPQGWYGSYFAIQVNGTGGNITGSSTLTFDNVTGIDFVYQEYVGTATSLPSAAGIRKPDAGQTQVTGFSGQDFMLAAPTETSVIPAGWVWLDEELSEMVIPLYFTAPAHVRFFNALNGNFKTTGTDYDGTYGLFGASSLSGTRSSNTITYNDIDLTNYMYNNTSAHLGDLQVPEATKAMFNARATGTIDVEFTVSETGTDDQYKATDWTISGQDVVLNYLGSLYVVADDFEISGEFGTASNEPNSEIGPEFTVSSETVTSVNDADAKFYVGGAAGSATINGITYTNISDLATDDCSELLAIAEDIIASLPQGI